MLQVWLITICLAAAYFPTSYAGLMLPAAGSHITLLWLPAGIAVATLYPWGIRLLARCDDRSSGRQSGHRHLVPLSFGIAVGNTIGPLLGTGIRVRTGFHSDLKRSQDILLLTVAAMVGIAGDGEWMVPAFDRDITARKLAEEREAAHVLRLKQLAE